MDCMDAAPIIVYPPDKDGGRHVRVPGVIPGRAYSRADLLGFLRRAGLHPDEVDLDDPELIEWRGGGPDVWRPHGSCNQTASSTLP